MKSTQTPKLSSKLRVSIARVRDHICGLRGVKAGEIADTTVAAFVTSRDYTDIYRHRYLSGLGYKGNQELLKWARRQLK